MKTDRQMESAGDSHVMAMNTTIKRITNKVVRFEAVGAAKAAARCVLGVAASPGGVLKSFSVFASEGLI